MEENNEKKELNKEEVINNNEEVDTNTNSCSNSNKKVIYIILGIAAFLLVCIIVFCNYYNSLTFKNNNGTTHTENTDKNVDKDDKNETTTNENNVSSNHNDTTTQDNSNTTVSKTTGVDISSFDFDKMITDINNSFIDGKKAHISKCTMVTVDDPNSGNYGSMVPSSTIDEISQDSFNVVVNKLKYATSFNEISLKSFDEKRGALSNGALSGKCDNRGIHYFIASFNGHAFDDSLTIYYSSDENDLLVEYNLNRYEFHYETSSDINNFIESLK